ncbi:hypothetical protein GGR51DRAFT_554477 [Nemania sp. FL0031]|nr:hypothetical protein GGR51DRAFT_554477 [Nemania sp. FL0031]
MTDYAAIYPTNVIVDERTKGFISAFYAISDDPSRNDEWVGCFAPDAVLVMGDKQARGIEDIRELRGSMWEKTKSRKHKLEKVYPSTFGQSKPESEWKFEYMLHGLVDLELRTTEKVAGQWAARAILTNHEGKLKYTLYQVYLHT